MHFCNRPRFNSLLWCKFLYDMLSANIVYLYCHIRFPCVKSGYCPRRECVAIAQRHHACSSGIFLHTFCFARDNPLAAVGSLHALSAHSAQDLGVTVSSQRLVRKCEQRGHCGVWWCSSDRHLMNWRRSMIARRLVISQRIEQIWHRNRHRSTRGVMNQSFPGKSLTVDSSRIKRKSRYDRAGPDWTKSYISKHFLSFFSFLFFRCACVEGRGCWRRGVYVGRGGEGGVNSVGSFNLEFII